jgi:dihydrofolate synthase / folylpolyglutamate synthase
MHRLTLALGMPQNRFASIHVVGTNGKSSVVRMTAALLRAHGLRAGAYVSPHPERWAERVLVEDREIEESRFAAAVEQTAEAAAAVNRALDDGEQVTQFEVATAAAFLTLAAAGVEVAVIEAGLGGRLDATNTIPSRVTALTSVGLDHTRWLGETEVEIAAEKLAVLRDHTTLVVGQLDEAVGELAHRTAKQRGARLVQAPAGPGPDVLLRARGAFQRRNFTLARATTEAFLGEVDAQRVAAVASELTVPGRLEQVADSPPAFVDAAHNPDGAAALAEALPEVAAGRTVVACLAILSDKDAAAMVAALAPALDRVVCTELDAEALAHRGQPGATSHPAGDLAAICKEAGLPAEVEPDFGAAVRRARELAAAMPEGALVVSGSHYALVPARKELRL